MKKVLLLAALLGGVSFAGNATTSKISKVKFSKEALIRLIPVKPALLPPPLLMVDFTCEKQGWTIPVVGYNLDQILEVMNYYQSHCDC